MSTFREVWSDVVSQIGLLKSSKNAGKSSSDSMIMDRLISISEKQIEDIFKYLQSSEYGLTEIEHINRLIEFGKNTVAQEKTKPWFWMLLSNFKNPFIGVLVILGIVSYYTNDLRGAIVVLIMVIVSVVMRFLQEYRSSKEAEALKALVKNTATVTRRFPESEDSEILTAKKLFIPS